MIPYGHQDVDQNDIDAVVEVLRSDFLTQGPSVPFFENSLINHCGVKYAVAVNSATSALHIACLALDVGPGDYVWTSPITFVASANCAVYCGAKINFVDIDPLTYNMSVSRLAEMLERAKVDNTVPKVVVVVHLSGQPCDMKGINRLSHQYGFKVIEDASHAIGAQYEGRPIGDCRYSDITVFSFHPVKIITTGEGGAAVTNDSELANKMALLRSHGITRNPLEMINKPDGPWYYEQIQLGFNYRMTDLQAALGSSQMTRLRIFLDQRHSIAKKYDELLKVFPLRLPYQAPDTYSSLHLYIIQIDSNKNFHKIFFEEMRASGIGVNLHYIPVYRHPYYQAMGFNPTNYPESETYYSQAISLPIFPGLSDLQLNKIASAVDQSLERSRID